MQLLHNNNQYNMAKLTITQRKRLSSVEAYFYTKSVKEGWEERFVARYNKKHMEGGAGNGEDVE